MPWDFSFGGSGGGRQTSNAGIFADLAALNVWGAANLTLLFNSDTEVTVATVGEDVFEWTGGNQPGSYPAGGSWTARDIAGPAGSGAELDPTAQPYELLMLGGSGQLMASGIRRLASGNGDLQFDETAQFPQESVQIGAAGIMSAFGAIPQVRSFVTGRRLIQPFTYWSKTDGTERTVEVSMAPTATAVVNSVDTTALPLTGTFNLVATSSEAITALYIRMTNGTGITGFRFRATIQGQTEPFYYYPTRADFEAGTGTDFADTTNTPNQTEIDIEAVPITVMEAQTIVAEYSLDAGDLLGDGTNPYLEVDRNIITFRQLAYLSETGNAPAPSIASFSINGQAVTVDGGTTIDGSETFNYSVINSANVNGTGVIKQAGIEIITGVDPTASSVSGAVTSVTLAAGESVTWTLEFTGDSGNVISRSFTVSARQQSEMLYHGVLATDTSATEPVGNLTLQDVISGSQFDADFDTPPGHFAVILTPADRDLTSIIERTFSAEILSDFVKVQDARTISGQLYNSYTHQNNAQSQGVLATQITVA